MATKIGRGYGQGEFQSLQVLPRCKHPSLKNPSNSTTLVLTLASEHNTPPDSISEDRVRAKLIE